IEVNPRASRTIPYISKVTGVPMVDVASRVMVGQPLKSLGYGTGLYKTPPYCAVKVPVFSFEKLTDVNAYLGPEMKSTGEVLGLGENMSEALFKGLTSAGFKMPHPGEQAGVLISVDDYDYGGIIRLARKFSDLRIAIYATSGTAAVIRTLGIAVTEVPGVRESDEVFGLLESGHINYVIYTGALRDDTIEDYIRLHRRSLLLGIPCLTSLDTADALADIITSRYNQGNTELVDINHMRAGRQVLRFAKMQASGNDYIYVNNMDGSITCPEAMSVKLCEQHFGVGADGLVLIEKSEIADAKMRIFNRDGSESTTAGNCIRCVAKYLYDNHMANDTAVSIETASGVKNLTLYTRFGKVTSACADMGPVSLKTKDLPCTLPFETIIDRPVEIGSTEYNITCVSVGNPHCVVFTDQVEKLDLERLGPVFENAPVFPERVNTEFIRVVNETTIKMRCYERGNGETMACGTGACAAVVAAVENGLCRRGADITVQVHGGNLIVNYKDGRVTLTGKTALVYEGELEY
ncbi:MAG: diaminopimelate epimerase, partial [Clostridia bacterium]|nr:diaminopimelate epimerase [Clostridia bacterium]